LVSRLLNHKKKLGQYFTGRPLAYLLSNLCYEPSQKLIIDPMCGTGDMLFSYHKINSTALFHGIEIDKKLNLRLMNHLNNNDDNQFYFINGNSFDINTIKKLPHLQYDLVITNPPYVRYQYLSNNIETDLHQLNSKNIRANLLKLTKLFSFEDESDRFLFRNLINNYSGLSDLAVPSWILCALLTRIGGTVALVVPETWLNRNYALIIQYLVLRWFKIKFIVEDVNSAWFPNAQVKTNLLIAKRIPRKPSAFSWKSEKFKHILLYANSQTSESIVGNIYPTSDKPEINFIKDLKKGDFTKKQLIKVNDRKIVQKANRLRIRIQNAKWINKLEQKNSIFAHNEQGMPELIKKWLKGSNIKFKTLPDYGVKVGQGLRTGANMFFYVFVIKELEHKWIISPNQPFRKKEIQIPKNCLKKVLIRQKELDKSYKLDLNKLTRGVLIFEDKITIQDFDDLEYNFDKIEISYSKLPDGISEHIKEACTKNIGSSNMPKYIPELSAVAPNIKDKSTNDPNSMPRFWYMLPPLKERHSPDLFIPRINNHYPKCIMNSEPKAIIDANFSTLWLTSKTPPINKYAILSILNSDWAHCLMELTSTVMGGGALKVEASHIRYIPIPDFDSKQISIFGSLGKKLVKNKGSNLILDEINKQLVRLFFGAKYTSHKIRELKLIKKRRLNQRSK